MTRAAEPLSRANCSVALGMGRRSTRLNCTRRSCCRVPQLRPMMHGRRTQQRNCRHGEQAWSEQHPQRRVSTQDAPRTFELLSRWREAGRGCRLPRRTRR